MPTYNEIKGKYDQDQAGMQQGIQQGATSVRTLGGAISARDDEVFVNSAAEGIGTLIGLGIRSNRMAKQNAKIEAINQAVQTCQTQLEQGSLEEAISTATKHLVSNEIVEARVAGYYFRSKAQFSSGHYTQAVEDLTQAIGLVEQSPVPLDRDALDGVLPMSYYGRARAFEEQQQWSEALRDLTKAIQLNPSWDVPYYSRCQVLCEIGEYDRALSDINQAIAIQPGDADNYRQRGRLYALLAAPDKALADFAKAVTLNRSATNLRARGQFYADQGDQAKALIDYSAALAIAPNDSATLHRRSALFGAMGAHVEAEADRTRAAELESHHTSFESYLDTAKAVYARGVTRVWTEADTHAKPNYLTAILLGIGVFVGTFMVLLLAAGIGDGSMAICLLAGLLLSPVLGVIVAINRIKEPKLQAKSATQYFDEMAACEEQMPRFSQFFQAYLAARTEGTLPKLEENTRPLFEQAA